MAVSAATLILVVGFSQRVFSMEQLETSLANFMVLPEKPYLLSGFPK